MANHERPMWLSPKVLIVGGVLLVASLGVLYMNFGSSLSAPALDPIEKTRNQLAVLQSEVISFVAREQRVPTSLDEVVTKGDKSDGWDSPIVLTPGTDGPKKASFTLRSSGKDKAPETPDDWITTVIFADDGYGKLGNERSSVVEPPA
jgi:hypothetical protein